MINEGDYRQAVAHLKGVHATVAQDEALKELLDAKAQVLARYQPTLTSEGVAQLTEEEFRDFLMFRNNRHWSGLQRLGPAITGDMDGLRKALHELLDENVPIDRRLNQLLPNGRARVKKLGKAVLTPILLIAHPDRYGVWNGTSEGAMRELGIWPDLERGVSVGERYGRMNELLLQLAEDSGVDLWTLDALWWRVLRPAEEIADEQEETDAEAEGILFGLERHLHDFLFDNWEKTELGQNWDLDEDGGDIKGYGYERPTPIGKIDLLAKHKTEQRWLVIELKRDQTSDATVGQVLRYMGWVEEHMAEKGETVEGLIIAHQHDEKIRYALKRVSDVDLMLYEVDFHLKKPGAMKSNNE